MAHHMLYTAMMEHNCYDGYLWAPFDTLLNIPRLQLFDQTKFWYYSPWGKYVPNPQVKADGNGGKHAPSARISPDPALNLTASWQGWAKDWWYVFGFVVTVFDLTVALLAGGGSYSCILVLYRVLDTRLKQ